MPHFQVQTLLRTPVVAVHDVWCPGGTAHRSEPETSSRTHLVFPYRGTWVRHLGADAAVADASQVLLFNAGETYRVSHPHPGSDASLVLEVDETLLRELAPPALLQDGAALRFRRQRLRIDPRAQVLVALLRHALREGTAEALEGESLALVLASRALGPRTAHVAGAGSARQRLVERTKLVLAGDLARRWTLAEIAAQVGVSPVYLTQCFRQVEGVPLYRYQVRLRLARALDRLAEHEDLSALALELGFSSHSHFAASFQQAYGRTPSAFRQHVLGQRRGAPSR
ncbi:helix-turn-helix domain-containing protein [Luteimonas saliphila]|uniref:helix-turn-helix domain-containing protein n=1 Tax=Luteimonas saliphila TaxID=2804919 RepID=UPI00192DB6A1